MPPRLLPPGRRAIQEGACASEQFDAFHELGGDELARQDAVDAVVRHVVRVGRKAANDEQLLEVAEATRDAHVRIVQQHIGDALRLLVAHQLLGVVRARERRLERVEVAEDAGAAAFRHLAARERIRQE